MMLKKICFGAAAATLAAGLMFGSDMFSYANTACNNVRKAVKSEITPEFELSRIRDEIDKLMPEIRQHMAIVAEQSVDVRDLDRDIVEKQGKLSRQKEAILALRADLSRQQDHYTYRQASYTRAEVEMDLEDRFEAYCVGEEAINRDRQVLAAQRQTLRANQQKLDSMLGRKEELAVKVSQLEARLKTIQATEAVNSIDIDDTHLARVEGMIKDLDHALDVRESMLQTEGNVLGRIPVEEDSIPVDGHIVSEIDQHFGLETVGTDAESTDSI